MGEREKVTGIKRATAIVAVRPGIPPTTIPEILPITTASRFSGLKRVNIIAIKSISIITPFS
jgi:hypothetical protein